MEKVYCKDCKWRKDIQHRDVEIWADIFKALGQKAVEERIFRVICKKKQSNLNNECLSYQHKWWKFWLKPPRKKLIPKL